MDMTRISREMHFILDSISDGLFTIDTDYRITFFNKAAERITKVPRKEAIGKRCNEVFKANICEQECALRKTLLTSEPVINKTVWIVDVHGTKIPISISTSVLRNEDGNFIGGVETFRDLSQIELLKKELLDKYTVYDIISKNNRIKDIFQILPDIAESSTNVLIDGPNGSGKELFAHAIHELSDSKSGPFIAVNLSALPDNLLESELFGYKKGAFTGALHDRPGRLAAVQGGTLFIDEIGDLSPTLQIKLLRVLQEKRYEPLGSTVSLEADCRFLFATNKDLQQLVKDGTFREDLYYRINVIKISLPSLKDRSEDIPLLIKHFIMHFNKINGKNIQGIDQSALARLMHHDFPGNVRELRNIIEHAFILCKDGWIGCQHMPVYLHPEEGAGSFQGFQTLEEIEKQAISDTLKRNNGRKKRTALELGIDYTTLWRKIKKYGLSG